jgi:hypothetical protein
MGKLKSDSKVKISVFFFMVIFVKIQQNLYQNTMPRILVAPLDWGMGHTTRCIALYKLCKLLAQM